MVNNLDNTTYNQMLFDVKSILKNGLSKAYKAVDNLKVQTYWQIGERIVREELDNKDRADYGRKIITYLSDDLKIDRRLFYRIVKFYRMYPIVVTVSPQLSWSHYEVLIGIIDVKRRKFYELKTVEECWSVRELKKRIIRNEFNVYQKENITIKQNKKLIVPEEIFKNTYNWNFLSLEETHSEKELENALMDNIQKTLLELGAGFAFVGRQQKILINNNWHNVDLLFYHILLKCHIIVELKARALVLGDIEQVTKYITYFKDNKISDDRDPIALIICKRHDTVDVYYSAGKNRDDIFVAEYKTKLPNAETIKSALSSAN